jgi:hypothetical protein
MKVSTIKTHLYIHILMKLKNSNLLNCVFNDIIYTSLVNNSITLKLQKITSLYYIIYNVYKLHN